MEQQISMTLYEATDLLASNRELIMETWNFFVSIHIALFGAIFIADNRISFRERFIIVPLYIGVMYINYRGQIDNYTNAQKLLTTITRLEEEVAVPMVERLSTHYEAGWMMQYMELIYLTCAGVSFFIVFILQIGQKERHYR